MCHKIKILSKTKNGEFTFCKNCKIFHLEYNNIYLEFTKKEFLKFKSYVNELEIAFWEDKYACTRLRRKIPIPTQQSNLVLMFNRQELTELKVLLNTEQVNTIRFLRLVDIDYTLIIN